MLCAVKSLVGQCCNTTNSTHVNSRVQHATFRGTLVTTVSLEHSTAEQKSLNQCQPRSRRQSSLERPLSPAATPWCGPTPLQPLRSDEASLPHWVERSHPYPTGSKGRIFTPLGRKVASLPHWVERSHLSKIQSYDSYTPGTGATGVGCQVPCAMPHGHLRGTAETGRRPNFT